ncbi:MAG: hypothetical protein ACI9DJ_000128, partial [Algoriphagus sp.]
GHPEGYIETFASIYRNFAMALRDRWGNALEKEATGGLGGGTSDGSYNADVYDFPGIEEGLRGMGFIQTVVKSSLDDDTKWTKFEI